MDSNPPPSIRSSFVPTRWTLFFRARGDSVEVRKALSGGPVKVAAHRLRGDLHLGVTNEGAASEL